MDIKKKINYLLIDHKIPAYKLAELMGISQPALSYKMKYESFTVNDLKKVAKAVDKELFIDFI